MSGATFDFAGLEHSVRKIALRAVDERFRELGTAQAQAETQAAIAQKRHLRVPQDIQAYGLGGRSACFEIANRADFPPTIKVGRQRFVSAEAFFSWLDSLAEKAS